MRNEERTIWCTISGIAAPDGALRKSDRLLFESSVKTEDTVAFAHGQRGASISKIVIFFYANP